MFLNKKDQEQLERIQAGLKCTQQEAMEVLESDKKIDRGVAMEFDLPAEKKKIAQTYTRTGTRTVKKPMVPSLPTKTRPKDATKEQIITEIAEFLRESASFQAENVEIPNSAKLITFRIGEQGYKIDLIATRKPKG